MNKEDRDLLIRIDVNLSNLIKSHDDHKEKLNDHVEDDRSQFSTLHKFMWALGGGGILLTFIISMFK